MRLFRREMSLSEAGALRTIDQLSQPPGTPEVPPELLAEAKARSGPYEGLEIAPPVLNANDILLAASRTTLITKVLGRLGVRKRSDHVIGQTHTYESPPLSGREGSDRPALGGRGKTSRTGHALVSRTFGGGWRTSSKQRGFRYDGPDGSDYSAAEGDKV